MMIIVNIILLMALFSIILFTHRTIHVVKRGSFSELVPFMTRYFKFSFIGLFILYIFGIIFSFVVDYMPEFLFVYVVKYVIGLTIISISIDIQKYSSVICRRIAFL